MLARLFTFVRALFLVAALVFAAGTAGAEKPHTVAPTTAQTKADTPHPNRDEFPLEGALIIAGIVGVVVVLAWVSSRINDNRTAP